MIKGVSNVMYVLISAAIVILAGVLLLTVFGGTVGVKGEGGISEQIKNFIYNLGNFLSGLFSGFSGVNEPKTKNFDCGKLENNPDAKKECETLNSNLLAKSSDTLKSIINEVGNSLSGKAIEIQPKDQSSQIEVPITINKVDIPQVLKVNASFQFLKKLEAKKGDKKVVFIAHWKLDSQEITTIAELGIMEFSVVKNLKQDILGVGEVEIPEFKVKVIPEVENFPLENGKVNLELRGSITGEKSDKIKLKLGISFEGEQKDKKLKVRVLDIDAALKIRFIAIK
jgi:hypothetical protein